MRPRSPCGMLLGVAPETRNIRLGVRKASQLIAFILALSLNVEARSAESELEEAQVLHDKARIAYARGDYRTAFLTLRRAAELDPKAKLLHYNLGLLAEKLGDFEAAKYHYGRCLALETNPKERVQLARIIKRIEGAKIIGKHGKPSPELSAPDPSLARAQPESDTDTSLRNAVYVSGAVTGAALVTGGILAGYAVHSAPGTNAKTDATTTVEFLRKGAERAHSAAIGADIAFAVAGVGVITTAVCALVLSGDDDEVVTEDATLNVLWGPTGASLRWTF